MDGGIAGIAQTATDGNYSAEVFFDVPGDNQVRAAWKISGATLNYSETIKVTVVETTVVDPRDVLDVGGPLDGLAMVTLARSASGGLEVGEVIATGVGPETPFGLLRRVESIEQGSDNVVLSTSPATLAQALTSGSASTTIPFEEAVVASQTGTLSSTSAAEGGFFDCSDTEGEIGLHLDYEINPRFEPFEIAWDDLGNVWVDIGVTVDGALTGSASASGKLTCSKTFEVIDNKRFKTFVFTIGGIPVVATPVLDVDLKLEAGVEGEISAEINLSGTSQVSASFAPSGASTNFTNEWDFADPSIDLKAKGVASATLDPTLLVEFYGLVGPKVGLPTSLGFDWELCRSPEWKVPFEVQFSAELSVPSWLTKDLIDEDDLKIDPISLYQTDLLTGEGLCRITPEALPVAQVDQLYDQDLDLEIAGLALAEEDVDWTLAEGEPPDGLALQDDHIQGTPRVPGIFEFTVKATITGTTLSKTKRYELVVTGPVDIEWFRNAYRIHNYVEGEDGGALSCCGFKDGGNEGDVFEPASAYDLTRTASGSVTGMDGSASAQAETSSSLAFIAGAGSDAAFGAQFQVDAALSLQYSGGGGSTGKAFSDASVGFTLNERVRYYIRATLDESVEGKAMGAVARAQLYTYDGSETYFFGSGQSGEQSGTLEPGDYRFQVVGDATPLATGDPGPVDQSRSARAVVDATLTFAPIS